MNSPDQVTASQSRKGPTPQQSRGAKMGTESRSITAYKVILLGTAGVGKTSLISRYIYHTFDPTYAATIGVDFVSKALQSNGHVVKLQLWDTAGQERFNVLIPSYVRDSCAAIVVYDISKRTSFEDVARWVKEVRDQQGNSNTLLALIGNKTDLSDRAVSREDGLAMCKQLGMTFFGETSAKENTGVDDLFRTIADGVQQQIPVSQGLTIEAADTPTTTGCSC